MKRFKNFNPPAKILVAWITAVFATIISGISSILLIEWLQPHPDTSRTIFMTLFWVYLIVSLVWLFDVKKKYNQWQTWRFWTQKNRGK